jgi:succinate dehydrogenase hydrophobic anchor subunit
MAIGVSLSRTRNPILQRAIVFIATFLAVAGLCASLFSAHGLIVTVFENHRNGLLSEIGKKLFLVIALSWAAYRCAVLAVRYILTDFHRIRGLQIIRQSGFLFLPGATCRIGTVTGVGHANLSMEIRPHRKMVPGEYEFEITLVLDGQASPRTGLLTFSDSLELLEFESKLAGKGHWTCHVDVTTHSNISSSIDVVARLSCTGVRTKPAVDLNPTSQP